MEHPGQPHTQARLLMGTWMEIRLWGVPRERSQEAAQAAFSEISRLQRLLSRFEPTSELNLVNRQAGQAAVPAGPELWEILQVIQPIAAASRGAFDPTCGAWVHLWEEAAKAQRAPASDQMEAARPLVGWEKLLLDPIHQTVRLALPGMRLDLGSAGKGYAVDRTVEILRTFEIPSGLVDAGGNFKIFGFEKPTAAGIEDPSNPDRLWGTVDLLHPSAASSSNAYRGWNIQGKSHGHLLDPRTGIPTASRVGATVLAESALVSDALSTVLMLEGPQAQPCLEKFKGLGLYLAPNGCWASPELNGHLAPNQKELARA